MLPDYHNTRYIPYKQRAMQRAAEEYRLAQTALAGRRLVAFRFYYRALAGFGHWLVASGYRLQKRYGALPDLAQPLPKPLPSNRRV